MGAVDDCVVGPVAEEMVGSLEAIIRRAGRYSPDARTHDDGWIAMDWLRGTASAGGRPWT